jgi:hypothetical protein
VTTLRALFLPLALTLGCKAGADQATTSPATDVAPPAAAEPTQAAPAPAATAAAPTTPATTTTSDALEPARGQEIGAVYESWLSPHQEGDEEENTPGSTPKQFKSTTPSKSRAEREAAGHRAHGRLRFTRDLSRVYVDVKIEGVDLKTVNMFHIHCGKPGILGPILIDFSQATDVQSNIADGSFSVEIRNEHIVKTSDHAHGLVGTFTAGCFIPSLSLGSNKPVKVSTVAGVAQLAEAGELYFNLHTTGQTYFGDIRGQLHRAER